MQHTVAVGADRYQVLQPRDLGRVRRAQRDPVVHFREPAAERSVQLHKIREYPATSGRERPSGGKAGPGFRTPASIGRKLLMPQELVERCCEVVAPGLRQDASVCRGLHTVRPKSLENKAISAAWSDS